MSDLRVVLEDVGKRYRLGEDGSGRRSRRDPDPGAKTSARPELWSLEHVSLDVAEGQALGIIGRNGAGKSTLLKIIGRITEPTCGVARTRGRVGSLLELGAGFHPLLTGRENVYLSAAILGLRKKEVDRRFDEIVAFAGVEAFLDTPVKRYSTGMYLRLAFAVGVHLDCEILLVDEVIAVGDAEFQQKCLGRMQSMSREGRTVLFVSHDLNSVKLLCDNTVWLEEGRIAAQGRTSEVVDEYLQSGAAQHAVRTLNTDPDLPITVHTVAILDTDGRPWDMVPRAEAFTVEVDYTLHAIVPELDVALQICTARGDVVIEEALSWDPDHAGRGLPGRYAARLAVPPVLRAGEYAVNLWVGDGSQSTLIPKQSVLRFSLLADRPVWSDRILDMGLRIDLQRIDTTAPEQPGND